MASSWARDGPRANGPDTCRGEERTKLNTVLSMRKAISKSVCIAIALLHLASCATAPADSKAPVVEAGTPARGAAGRPASAPAVDSRQATPAGPSRDATGLRGERLSSPAPATEPRSTGTAVLALLQTADLQRAEGQLAASAASLERALRIEPQNPWTWYRLASVRLEQGRLDQAEQLARRCDSLAGSDNEVRARAWRLIAMIHERRGDAAGAREASRRAEALEPGFDPAR
ncbi:MAG: tetratricopeptide repeat protein [Gammaproteobacteria bacterium]|nr:tetratricopeptide repeat protein [Gammaproteobacteria bacterium]